MIDTIFKADRIYSTQEIADLLSVHPQTVKRWLRDGELPGSLLADRTGWRVVGADLIAFWQSRSNQPTVTDHKA